ncbi:MAG: cyclic nucleotide-binding domain-containing protein, partial [Elusimicrobia bacterium]|nr:cyclic nucleotide-binding domain-containing protein [Elusimicrobiota bacterium]
MDGPPGLPADQITMAFDVPFLTQCRLVKRIPIFSSLNWFRLQMIARQGEFVRYKKGGLLVEKGAPADFVFFVISGRITSFVPEDGERREVEFIHKGMFFGIISALTGETHSQTFEALNDSTIFRIPVARFKTILEKVPGLGVRFSRILSQRIRNRVTRTSCGPRSTIISVYGPVAGAGGSTYALHLALALARETSDPVALVSIRSQKTADRPWTSGTDEVRPKWKALPRDLSVLVPIEQISSVMTKGELPVDLLNVTFETSTESLVQNIADFVSGFSDEYRYVIVDLPSELDDVVMKTLVQSDHVHLLTLPKPEAFKAARAVLDRLEQGLKAAFSEDRVKIFLSGAQEDPEPSLKSAQAALDYDVTDALPPIGVEDLTFLHDSATIEFKGLDPICPYQRTVSKLARELSGVSIGLVLGGGAAFGLAHIGVLRVLEEEKVPIDVVVGSSMGALIGGLWAVGYSSDELEKMAREFRNRSSLVKLMDFVFPLSGLISGKAITAWLNAKFRGKAFSQTRIPLKVVAYDLIRRKDLVIDDGDLAEAIRKSISIPGVFQPITTQDQLIIDGGVMNPLPTDVLVARGVKRIIAVNVLQTPEDVIKGYQKT